jgi:hypothetical protein
MKLKADKKVENFTSVKEIFGTAKLKRDVSVLMKEIDEELG